MTNPTSHFGLKLPKTSVGNNAPIMFIELVAFFQARTRLWDGEGHWPTLTLER